MNGDYEAFWFYQNMHFSTVHSSLRLEMVFPGRVMKIAKERCQIGVSPVHRPPGIQLIYLLLPVGPAVNLPRHMGIAKISSHRSFTIL